MAKAKPKSPPPAPAVAVAPAAPVAPAVAEPPAVLPPLPALLGRSDLPGFALLLAAYFAAPAWQFPHVAAAAAALAALGLGVALLRAAGRGGVAAAAAQAVLAAVAAAWMQDALPAHARWGEPVRAAVAGVGPLQWACAAVPALLALGWRQQPAVRAAAGAGVAGLFVHAWMPAGVAGDTVLPALAGLGTLKIAGAAGQAPVETAMAGGAWMLLLGALTALALAALWARKQWPRPWALAAGLGLAATVLLGAAESGTTVLLAQLGALAAASGALLPVLCPPEADLPPAPDDWGRAAEPWLVALLVATFALLKLNGLRYSTTDEALYFYAAKLWSEGALPYRDFFFSHPPLHIAVPALLYKFFGYQFLIGKLLSAGAALLAALFSWRIARHWLGAWGGVLALALNLLACEVLQASTNLTGINLTSAWLFAGLWLLWVRRADLAAGLCMGAAAATGFYSFGGWLGGAVLCLLLPWPKKTDPKSQWLRHPAVRLTVGFLAVWGGINLIGIAVGGDSYKTGVYAYHFAKKAKVEGFVPLSEGGPFAVASNFFLMLGARDFAVTTYYHAAHWWMALWLPAALLLRARLGNASQPGGGLQLRDVADPRRWWPVQGAGPLLAWALGIALLVEFGQFKERYDFYFALILPLASLCAAAFVVETGRLGALALQSARNGPALAFAGAALLGLCWMPVDMAANRKAYPTEFGGAKMDGLGPGERLQFEWLPTPGPAWTSEWTLALLWQDHRIRASVEAGIHHYLWGKKRWFSKAEEMAAYIRDHSAPDETITGASDYAPLLALLSGRRMAGNHVDTNSKVFNTGTVPLEKFWADACRDKLKFIVAAPQSYFAAQDMPRRATIAAHFERAKGFADPALKHWKPLEMELWVRKTAEPCQFVGQGGAAPAGEGDR